MSRSLTANQVTAKTKHDEIQRMLHEHHLGIARAAAAVVAVWESYSQADRDRLPALGQVIARLSEARLNL